MIERAVLDRIMVVIDGLDPSYAGLAYALDLAEAAHGELTVLIHTHNLAPAGLVFTPQEMVVDFGSGWIELIEQATDMTARQVINLAKSRGLGANVRRDMGSVRGCIQKEAKDNSLVVVDRRGRGMWRPGSPASSAVKAAQRMFSPVLIAPQGYCRLERVSVAYDGANLAQHALRLGGALSGALHVPLEVLTVSRVAEEGERVLGKAHDLLGDGVSGVSFVPKIGEPGDVIVAQSWPNTLLVMGSSAHSLLRRIVFGSVTDKALRHGNGPVLIAGEPAASAGSGSDPTTSAPGPERSAA